MSGNAGAEYLVLRSNMYGDVLITTFGTQIGLMGLHKETEVIST